MHSTMTCDCRSGGGPSTTTFCRKINEEENHNATVVSMEPNHGDSDHTAASADSVAWIDLPIDICHIILDHLAAFDVLSFPLVCTPWANAYAKKRRLQPGAPTLLTSPSNDGCDMEDDYQRGLFFINNILSREALLVEVDGLRSGRRIGGKDEWLVAAGQDGRIFKLLNPIKKTCIPLPSNLQVYLSVDRVQLCRAPTRTEPDDYFAIAISADMLAYTADGSYHWIILENPNEHELRYSDAIMHHDKVIAICRSGNIWSWDLGQGGKNPKLLLSSCVNSKGWKQYDFILALSVNNNILIVSPYGDYAPIRWGSRNSCHGSSHMNFLVDGVVLHEVDIDAQSIEEVRDIGDQALFLGPNYPFYVPVSAPSGDLKKNYVYISDVSDDDVVAINLNLEDLPGNVSLINYSGPDNPYQVPMWFRPAFP